MLPILLGIAAIALFSGCSRSNSDNPPPPSANPPTNPEDPHAHCHPSGSGMAATPAPTSGNYPCHRSLQFADARSEYVDLCEVLFNTRDAAQCDAMQASAAATQTPSTDAGLNAYYRGISRGLDGYSFTFADRDARWSNRLHRLQGAPLYLAGHGGCPADNPRASTCLKLNGGTEIPAEFNFMDDYYNLLGTFFFLQANRDAIGNGAHCTIVAATLGSEDRPFCHAFAMHNLVLTPISNRLRGVDPTVHLSRLRGVETSECH
ncbi:MAG: hypothetical protein K8R69_05105 [Deltaproteobacteria bacterium]|nr:hypothetical protein [Deltaproteobacteria bacterium]